MISEKIIDNLIEILDKNFLNDPKIRLNVKSLLEHDLLRDNICNCFTNKGKRCKNKKKKDELYCGVHLKEKEKLKKYLIEKNIIKIDSIKDDLIESDDDNQSYYNSEYDLTINESEDEDTLPEFDYNEGVEDNLVNEFSKKINILQEKKEKKVSNLTFLENDELDFDN